MARPRFWDLGAFCTFLWQGHSGDQAGLGQGGPREEGALDVRGDNGPHVCGQHPILSLIAREVGMCHPGSTCPVGDTGRGCNNGLPHGGWHGGPCHLPTEELFPISSPSARFCASHWVCAGMDAVKKGKKKNQKRGEEF